MPGFIGAKAAAQRKNPIAFVSEKTPNPSSTFLSNLSFSIFAISAKL